MFCFHYVGQITCCKDKWTGEPYYSLYLPTQSWAQKDKSPSFTQTDIDWCGSFNENNHILHKKNVEELNSFVKSDLKGYRMADDMLSVLFTTKSGKSFTASLVSGKLNIIETQQTTK